MQETHKQHLCLAEVALLFEFGALSNIFQKENAYFIHGLHFFRGEVTVQNVSNFQLKFITMCVGWGHEELLAAALKNI